MLIGGLQSPDVLHRDHAAHAAMWTKPLPLAVVPVLLNCFKDLGPHAHALNLKGNDRRDRENYRENLVSALSNVGPKAIPLLTAALDDPDAAVRAGAVDAFGADRA
jgi:HEAT repeat protein